MELKDYLKKWRIDNYYSHTEMAERAGIDVSQYCLIENGNYGHALRRVTLDKLAKATETTTKELLKYLKEN